MQRSATRTFLAVTMLAAGMLGGGCGKKPTPVNDERVGRPIVYTTLYPTKYFTERIGGDLLEVVCPVPVDEDVTFWMPDVETIAAYQQADLIVINGAEFAKWVRKVSLPLSRVVDTARPLKNEFIDFESTTVHSHGKGGKHAHEGIDGHTWMDPENAKIQAGEIKKALVKRFPKNEAAFQAGFVSLARDLDAVAGKLGYYKSIYKDQPLLASHPAFNYIASRYQWNLVSLDLGPDTVPSDEAITEINAILRKHPAKYLIWEEPPSAAVAERIRKELGLVNVVFSPCELLSEQELADGKDYMTVMRRNLSNISVIFE